MLTKTELAKHGTDIVIGGVTAKAVETTIYMTTDIEEDNTVVSIGSLVTGLYVSHKLSPLTHTAIDKIAARWQARKDRKNSAPETEK